MVFTFRLKYILMQLISNFSMKATLSKTLRPQELSELSMLSWLLQIEAGLCLGGKYKIQEADFHGERSYTSNTQPHVQLHIHTWWLFSIKTRNLALKAGLWRKTQSLFPTLTWLPPLEALTHHSMFFQLVLQPRGGWSTTAEFFRGSRYILGSGPLTNS